MANKTFRSTKKSSTEHNEERTRESILTSSNPGSVKSTKVNSSPMTVNPEDTDMEDVTQYQVDKSTTFRTVE